jgi:hypothetical protein
MYFSKKYSNLIRQNFLVTNTCGIAWATNEDLVYRLHSSGIESHLAIQSYFLYLLLTTKTFPFLARKYPSKKKFHFGEARTDTTKIVAYPGQVKLSAIFHQFMHKLMKDQLSPEPSSIKLEGKFLKIIIWNSPLNKKTYCIQTSESAFIKDIPLYLKFDVKKSLRREIGVWVFFQNFLKVKDWWSMRQLKVLTYDYYDEDYN